MRICYWPGRERGYIRTTVMRRAMEYNGYTVDDCSAQRRDALRYLVSFGRFLRYVRRADVVVIGFCGQPLVLIARLFTRKPIVFDVYISLYETLVHERKRLQEHSPLARVMRWLDHTACRLAGRLILDTQAHIRFFQRMFPDVPAGKFYRVPASCGETRKPASVPVENKPPVILHYGEFQSLHGAPYIVRAAASVPEARFILIGKGRELDRCRTLADELKVGNVVLKSFMPYDKLLDEIAAADICLGIFGGTPKANMVVPNKIYDYLSHGKAIITQSGDAMAESFTDGEELFCCEPRSGEALAAQIRILLNDPELRRRLAERGGKAFQERYDLPHIAGQVKAALRGLTSTSTEGLDESRRHET